MTNSQIPNAGVGVYLAEGVTLPSNFLIAGLLYSSLLFSPHFLLEYDGDRSIDKPRDGLNDHNYWFALPDNKSSINGALSLGIAPVLNHDYESPNCFSRWERVKQSNFH